MLKYLQLSLHVCCAPGMIMCICFLPCVQMKTVSDPGVPVEECLQVLTWQGVVVEASGNVFMTHSDKMDSIVVKGIAIAFNNMNSVFASTMKDVDQLLAAVSCGCNVHL